MGQELNRQIFTGVFWNFIQIAVNKSFGFLVKLVLARLLMPEQFGLVGMAVVFTGFVNVLNDVGISAALIQRRESELNETHFHTAFWTGVVWSVLIYFLMVFIIAPFGASFYEEPILRKVISILSLGILASPMTLIHKTRLTRAMDFKKISHVSNLSVIVTGVISVLLALGGFGIWALVFNGVAGLFISVPFFFMVTKWTPKLTWNKSAFREIFGFGVFTTGTKVANYFSNNMDYLIVGKLVSASALGYYSFVYLLTGTLKGQLMNIINQVMYPVYGKNQDNPKNLKKYYLKVVRYNCLGIFPIMALMLGFSRDLIQLFFGDKWIEAATPIQILSVAVIFSSLTNSVSSLIRGMGFASLEFRIQLLKAIFIYVPLIYLGVYYFGVNGAATAILLNKISFVIISQYFLKRLLGITYIDLFNSVKEPLLALFAAIIAILLLFQIEFSPTLLSLLLVISIYSGVIFLTMREELKNLKNQLGNKRILK